MFIVKLLCRIPKFKEHFWEILKPLTFAIIGGVFSYGVSLLFGFENIYLNAGLIAMLTGVVVLVLNILFNHEFVDLLLELCGKRKKA